MEPVSIALICAVAFGGVMALSSFVRQLFISRDKELNDKAQHRALLVEAAALEKMRLQMDGRKRFDLHYQLLGSNKDAISYIDNQIQEILNNKSKLIERHNKMTVEESSSTICNGSDCDRKRICDHLKDEIDKKIDVYNTELYKLQKRREQLWDTNSELLKGVLEQEHKHNDVLDKIYRKQTGILEKLFIRNSEESESVAKESIQAGNIAFKQILMAPLLFLTQYFNPLKSASPDQAMKEQQSREDVSKMEDEINNEFSEDASTEKEDAFSFDESLAAEFA